MRRNSFKVLLILFCLGLFSSCDMNKNATADTNKGVLSVPSQYVGTWFCSSDGGMEWVFTKDNAVFFSTSSSLNISSLGANVQSYVGSEDGIFYIKFNDTMYEEFFIKDNKLHWRSSNKNIGFIFNKQ